MGSNRVRWVALRLTAAASLLWLGGAQGQTGFPGSCQDLGTGWQTMAVSGQTSAGFTATGGRCLTAPCEGSIITCYNPQDDCYLAAANYPFFSLVPFTAAPAGNDVAVASADQCGGKQGNINKSFNATLSSTSPGSGCLNRLIVTQGSFGSGELVNLQGKPAVKVETSPPVLVDAFVGASSLDVPGFHQDYAFQVHVPLADGAISVRNQTTGQLIGGGSVNNTCGARIGPPPSPIPTVPQYGLLLLTLGLTLAAVVTTRRRMAA